MTKLFQTLPRQNWRTGQLVRIAYKLPLKAGARSPASSATTGQWATYRVYQYLLQDKLQALERKPITVRDCSIRLYELLDHAGKVPAEHALPKAVHDRHQTKIDAQPHPKVAEFNQLSQKLKQWPRP
jgi:hypothetical protein